MPFTQSWTPEEIEFVKKNYKTMNAQEITKIINRSVVAIRQEAQRLGVASHLLPIKDGLTRVQRYRLIHQYDPLNALSILKTDKKQYQKNSEKKRTIAMIYHWTETHRAELLEKYGKKCARCGYSEFESALDVHHINGRKDEQNIILLCSNCHKALHFKQWKMEELLLLNQ